MAALPSEIDDVFDRWEGQLADAPWDVFQGAVAENERLREALLSGVPRSPELEQHLDRIFVSYVHHLTHYRAYFTTRIDRSELPSRIGRAVRLLHYLRAHGAGPGTLGPCEEAIAAARSGKYFTLDGQPLTKFV